MTPPDPVYLKQYTNDDDDYTGLSSEALLVRNTLIDRGLETPMVYTGLSNEQKYQRIKELMSKVVGTLGLDLNDDSLAETPHRIAKCSCLRQCRSDNTSRLEFCLLHCLFLPLS